MEYLSEEDGYPEPQLIGLELWGVPALQEVTEEERGREDEEEREEDGDEDLVGVPVSSQLSRYDDQFVLDEVLLNTTVPDPIRLKGIGGVTL